MDTVSCDRPAKGQPVNEPVGRHAQSRCLERYDIPITASEIRGLEERLAAGEGMVLRRYPADGSETRVIRFQGELVTLVFGVNGFIYTFLPRDAPFKRPGVRYREGKR